MNDNASTAMSLYTVPREVLKYRKKCPAQFYVLKNDPKLTKIFCYLCVANDCKKHGSFCFYKFIDAFRHKKFENRMKKAVLWHGNLKNLQNWYLIRLKCVFHRKDCKKHRRMGRFSNFLCLNN